LRGTEKTPGFWDFRDFWTLLRIASLLALATLAIARAQAPAQNPASPPEQPTFHIGVDAVRLDAVVTDKDGNLVTDLTADEFEVYEDRRLQKVVLATFVPVADGQTRVIPAASPSLVPQPSAPAESAAPQGSPVRRPAQRSIVILVDDLGLSRESITPMREALHQFIDQGLQPTDLASIWRLGMNGALPQPLTTARKPLHSSVDQIEWTVLSRFGVEPFVALEGRGFTGSSVTGGGSDPSAGTYNAGGRAIHSALATLRAVDQTIRAMRTFPGRKAIALMTEGFFFHDGSNEVDPRIQAALDGLWDQASRAGVVVYTLEARGLQTGMLLASDNTSKLGEAAVRGAFSTRHGELTETQDSLDLVARETGGFAVMNTNDLAAGLQRIVNDVRGFYILGYTPDATTFAKKSGAIQFHKIAVKVKRPGLKVRQHQRFRGEPDPG
jgi:VWFA-related protein